MTTALNRVPMFLWLVMIASGARAQDLDTPVRALVDSARMTIGDRVTLTLTVDHERGATVVFPDANDAFQPFELIRRRVLTFPDSATASRSGMEYVLTVFDVGEQAIPSVDVLIGADGGSDPRVIASPPVSITVESVAPDSSDIVDIKPPLEIARNWLLVLPWIVLAAALLSLGYWGYRRYRKRTVGASAAPATPARPAHIVALEALDQLESSNLLEEGKIKRYFSELSEIVRVYLDGRFGIDAMEMTSPDVLYELRRRQIPSAVLAEFRAFFTTSDLVKFAKLRPAPSACRAMVPHARALVNATAPREAQRAEDAEAPGPKHDMVAGGV